MSFGGEEARFEHEIGTRVERVEIVTFDEERLWAEDEG